MEIIVISVSKYKEKDAVITAISNSELISFYARGVFSPTNKNAFLTNVLTKANITLVEGKITHPILESAELILSPLMKASTYEKMTAIVTIAEAIFHLFEESEKYTVYPYLNECIYALKNDINPYLVVTYFFLKIMPIIGFGIEVNKCVCCGTKNGIVDFSFIEGGFLCSKCMELEERRYTNNQLMLIRNTILATSPADISMFDPEDTKIVLNDLNEFIFEGIGYRVQNLLMLLK